MRSIALSALLLAAAASSSCLVLALQPAYDAASVVFDERLVGQWENVEDQTSAAIERAEWRSYKISYTDRFSTRSFHGNLTKIGATLFLDLTEIRGVDPGPFLVPVHGVFRIELGADTISAAPLDYNWFMRAVAQKATMRLNVSVDDRKNVIVASATSALQQWLKSAPPGAFSAPTEFKRKP